MCFSFTLTQDVIKVAGVFGFKVGKKLLTTKKYNIAPTDYACVISKSQPDTVLSMRWGVHYSNLPTNLLLHCKGETVQDKPLFKNDLPNRCIILADGYFEKNGTDSYYIHLEDKSAFAMAGLFNSKASSNGEIESRFVIFTKSADEKIARVNDRMPVILPQSEITNWLDANQPISSFEHLFTTSTTSHLSYYKVGLGVGNSRLDNAQLLNPAFDLFT